MAAPVSEAEAPLLALTYSQRPERPAQLPPVEDHAFLLLVKEAHPDLEHASQQHRKRGEVVHVFRDRVSSEFTVLYQRANGRHTVKESGYPWLDRLNQLAGMWQATQVPQRGGAR
ncbi:hypothetical protein [Haloactinomyces albus]|uniref:Uncharacterized protein n=1 Tax=Haloactinomyces albus TaxID=1352928 RepID=A0AAE4CRM8_9ACTN|nr:hypothetical protein [Haloactinomyces albus]MDR7303868.1 hypothetical protein [Haloactinomyces albus]